MSVALLSYLASTVPPVYALQTRIVATGVPAVSPSLTDYYEGEKRVVNIGGNFYAFYFNGTSLVYKAWINGTAWNGTYVAGMQKTGALAPDSNRWALGTTTVNGNQYVSLVYWHYSGTQVKVEAIRGLVTPGKLISSWSTPYTLLTLSNKTNTSCPHGLCIAAHEANATNGTLLLTVRWLDSSSHYSREKFRSNDGGLTFPKNWGAFSTSDTTKIEIVMTRLANGNMLQVQARYGSPDFSYWVYNSTTGDWAGPSFTTGANMTNNAIKQISADSDTSNSPYIAYVTGNPSGALKVARWFNNGTFNKFETANSTLSHALPSITITRDNVVHIYTIASSGGSNKVWETTKNGTTWLASTNAFGSTFNSPDQITAAISYPGAIWEENSATPYNLMFESTLDKFGIKKLYPTNSSGNEWYSSWNNGHARVINMNGKPDPDDSWLNVTGFSYPTSTGYLQVGSSKPPHLSCSWCVFVLWS
ncbi:MAG: hypothetical protein E6K91_09060 [Thaumarchaeota archaeon]|nr:MAG: hypothetical protein E6K91_09060 [Nitrososphaerota archaeon]